jgi:hypothetical protein
MERRGLAPSSIRRKLSALSSLFDYLCERNAVAGNPVDGVKRPMSNGNEGNTPALGTVQARKLLEAPPATRLNPSNPIVSRYASRRTLRLKGKRPAQPTGRHAFSRQREGQRASLRRSGHPKNSAGAKQFVEWATSKDYIKLVAEDLGWASVPPGTRKSTYENPEYQKAAPFTQARLKAMETADPTNRHAMVTVPRKTRQRTRANVAAFQDAIFGQGLAFIPPCWR